MKIGQITKEKGTSLSFEFFPPKDQAGEDRLFAHINKLKEFHPTFVSVTYGAGGSTAKNTKQVIQRIKQETSLIPMPHLTCIGQTKKELQAILEDYKEIGLKNVLALRGDPPPGVEEYKPREDGFAYAKDLVEYVTFISDFSIGVAVYPEGHFESPNLAVDMDYTKEKIEAGADFAITQMFFDNLYYYDFLDRSARAGIRIPIIPGIMPINDIGKIKGFAERCGATIPARVIRRFEKHTSNPEDMKKAGIEFAIEQCADLMAHGIPYLHFFTLNQSDIVLRIVNNLGLQRLGLKK
jgi:methylenetetrahydrofolate reductase (NADPH)